MLLVTGTVTTALQVNGLPALWQSSYGRVLLIKLGVVALVLAAGGYNLLVLRPRVVAMGGPEPKRQRDRRGRAALLARSARDYLRTMRIEVAGAIVLLLAAGVLTSFSPPRTPMQANQLEASGNAGNYDVALKVAPGSPGINTFELRVEPERGAEPSMDLVRLLFQPTSGSVAQSELDLQLAGEGLYVGRGASLSQAGAWQVQAALQPIGGREQRANLSVEVRPTPEGPGPALERALDTSFLVGLGLAIVGAVLVVFGATEGLGSRTRGVLALGVATLLVGAGGFVSVRERWEPIEVTTNIPTLIDVQRGKEIYEARCVSCHGVQGRGDGPDAASLRPPPADMRAHVPYHPDEDLAAFIRDGIPGTAMPAYRDQLTDQQILQLIAYVRDLVRTP
jgi:mono/diheme cytochrome c family protein